MTGLQTIADLRRAGVKPKSVFVHLVDALGAYDAELYAFDEFTGIVCVHVARSDSLAGLDFRPLTGLRVHLSDFTGDSARYRKAAKLIADAGPAHLVMVVWEGETLAVHQRRAGDPARTESFRV